jgi:cytochrome b561
MARNVTGYSTAQVALHWAVVVLVAFQFLAHDGMEESWNAFERGEAAPADASALTYLHIGTGILVLLLALARVFLRVTRGAPKPPADEARIMQILAEATHGVIYLLLFLLPVSGMVAWFGGIERAGDGHEVMTNVLFFAIVLHIGGALFQHFVKRSDVLMRMLRPQRD